MGKRSRKPKHTVEAKVLQRPVRFHGLDTELLAVLAIVAVWVLAALLINPRGNFPLNDDWCYGKAVFTLLRTHQFHMDGIVTMTLVAQVLWGALFCSIFGASFTVLRISTLILGLGGLLAAYGLLREARAPKWIASFGCIVIALNPLYLSLSYSFMTDVPFTCVSLMAVYAYVKALKHDSIRMIALGTVLACIAVLIRQLGVMLPIAFSLGYLVKNGTKVPSIIRSIVPVAIVGLVLSLYLHWLRVTGNLPEFYGMQERIWHEFLAAGPQTWLINILSVGRALYVYMGLFTLPFFMLSARAVFRSVSSRQRVANSLIALVSAVVVMATLAATRTWMPLVTTFGNYILDFGIGPPTLPDVFNLSIPNYPTAPESLWIVVTIAGVAGGALLLWHILAALEVILDRDQKAAPPFVKGAVVLTSAFALMYVAPTALYVAGTYADRYFLCAVPMLIIAAAFTADPLVKPSRPCIASGLLVLLLLGSFSIGATHDYLAWNRMRWLALDDLVKEKHATPKDMEGGYEFKNSVDYDDVNLERNWRWNDWHRYMLAFGPVEGYDEAKRYPYRRWMPPGEGSVYVLDRY